MEIPRNGQLKPSRYRHERMADRSDEQHFLSLFSMSIETAAIYAQTFLNKLLFTSASHSRKRIFIRM